MSYIVGPNPKMIVSWRVTAYRTARIAQDASKTSRCLRRKCLPGLRCLSEEGNFDVNRECLAGIGAVS